MCVISTLVKAMLNLERKIAFGTQNVEADSTLQEASSKIMVSSAHPLACGTF